MERDLSYGEIKLELDVRVLQWCMSCIVFAESNYIADSLADSMTKIMIFYGNRTATRRMDLYSNCQRRKILLIKICITNALYWVVIIKCSSCIFIICHYLVLSFFQVVFCYFQYAIFMIVMMVLKIAMATLIFVKQNSLLDEIPRWLGEAFTRDRQAFQEIERSVSYLFNLCPRGIRL